jgi:hypothetical protein
MAKTEKETKTDSPVKNETGKGFKNNKKIMVHLFRFIFGHFSKNDEK